MLDGSGLGSGGDAARGASAEVGTLAHRYGREFVASDPSLALEYYMQAAAAMGGSLAGKLTGRQAAWHGMALHVLLLGHELRAGCSGDGLLSGRQGPDF